MIWNVPMFEQVMAVSHEKWAFLRIARRWCLTTSRRLKINAANSQHKSCTSGSCTATGLESLDLREIFLGSHSQLGEWKQWLIQRWCGRQKASNVGFSSFCFIWMLQNSSSWFSSHCFFTNGSGSVILIHGWPMDPLWPWRILAPWRGRFSPAGRNRNAQGSVSGGFRFRRNAGSKHPAKPLAMTNIAMENAPFTEDLCWFPFERWWFSIAIVKSLNGIEKKNIQMP